MTTTLDLLKEARDRLDSAASLFDLEMVKGTNEDIAAINDLCARLDAHIARESALQALTDDAQAMGLYEPKVGVSAPYYPTMPQDFTDYIATQMPPDTIISDPRWWAPRIWRTAMRMSAAPQPSPAVPTGWKLVPVELTEEMIVAAIAARKFAGGKRDLATKVHLAMLAAAPTPPKGE